MAQRSRTAPGNLPRTRALCIVFATAASVLVGPLVTSASARPIICVPGDKVVHTSNAVDSRTITHVRQINLAPGTSWNQSTTITWVKTVKAGINVDFSASVKGDLIIASGEITSGYQLQLSGEWTKQTAYTDTVTLSNPSGSGSDKTWAVYHGTVKVSGDYTYKICSNDGTFFSYSESGTWQSWTVDVDGTALCPRSRYASGTFGYKALSLISCKG